MTAFYLDTFTGDGTSLATAFRCTSGGDIIDLRADATRRAGFCLSSVPSRNDGPRRTFLGLETDLDLPASPAALAALAAALSVTGSAPTLRGVLLEILYRPGAVTKLQFSSRVPADGVHLGGTLATAIQVQESVIALIPEMG